MKRFLRYMKQDMKIKTKLFLNNLLLVLVPGCLIMLFFYNSFYSSALNEVLEQRRIASEKCAQETGAVIDRMIEISDMVINNQLLTLLNSLDNLQDEKKHSLVDNQMSVFQSVLESHINDEEIQNIKIFTEEDTEVLNGLGRNRATHIFEPFSEIRYSYWRNLMEIRGETKSVFTGYYLNDYERDNYGSLSYVNKLTYYHSGRERQAYVIIYYDISKIGDLLNTSVNLPGESAYLVDSQNITVGFTNASDLGVRTIEYEDLDQVYSGEDDFEETSLAESSYYFRYCEIQNTDWKLEWLIPKGSPVQESKRLLWQFFIQYSVILLAGFGLSILISRTILQRLYYLKDQMKFVKEKRPVPIEGEFGTDIVGELIQTYNEMTERINIQIDKEMKISEELYEYRLQALRAQIDPHFLYNTLDMIKWMAKKGACGEVEDTVVTLSRFYRLSLNKGNAMISIEKELEQVTLYVELMNRRFGGNLNFLTDVPDEMMDFQIPMMIFQPIVENAIIHGILEKESQEGVITIVGWWDEESLYFEVADDGVGIKPEVLEKINRGENVKSSSGSGIGVYNTKRRLELLYSEKTSVIRYESEPGEGTVVHICIRKEKAGETKDED